jgi:hypothetical protein
MVAAVSFNTGLLRLQGIQREMLLKVEDKKTTIKAAITRSNKSFDVFIPRLPSGQRSFHTKLILTVCV